MNHQKEKTLRDITALELMILIIQKYRDNAIYVNNLIYGLESSLKQLETINWEWRQQFFSKWETLEITYSLSLDEEREVAFDEENDEKIILNTLDQLEKMVSEKLRELKKFIPEEDLF